jgi:hypothetical protein
VKSNAPHIAAVHLCSNTTADQARDARVRAWVFIFDCYAKKTARTRGGEDAMKGSKNDRASTT